MKRHLETTEDGSSTLMVTGWGEPYHSMHGAIQEAYHVFINKGLRHCNRTAINLLEMGFGTGLNALITLMESEARELQVTYSAIEAFPVTPEEISQLNYVAQLKVPEYQEAFERMHTAPWESPVKITDTFTLHKKKCDFLEVSAENRYQLIYFDAFGARVQPELWTEALFCKMYNALQEGGELVTYAAKGSVRRAMQAVGFDVERLPGPPGKREMLRATKRNT